MGEERRFIRGIIPGLVFFVELSIVLLFLLDKCQIHSILKKSSNIGTPFLVFISSGGIGYFLGIVHRFIYWVHFPLNFRKIITNLISNNNVDLRIADKKINKSNEINQNGSWRILNEIFYIRKESTLISGPEERNDRLFDNMHSSGTSFWGFIIIIIIVIISFHFGYLSCNAKTVIGIIVIIVLLITHSCEYFTARNNALFFLEVVLTNELYSYKEKENKSLRIYIAKGDIIKKYRVEYEKDEIQEK